MRLNPRGLPANPFLIWIELSVKTSEMLLASAQVIGHRTSRMVMAGARPNPADRREFTLMGQEKVEAALESAHAMATHLTDANQQLWSRAVGQINSSAQTMLSLTRSRSSSQAIERQTHLVKTMTRSLITATQMSHTAARFAHSGLLPVHSRATANATRLRAKNTG